MSKLWAGPERGSPLKGVRDREGGTDPARLRSFRPGDPWRDVAGAGSRSSRCRRRDVEAHEGVEGGAGRSGGCGRSTVSSPRD
jgi:hypothetical protein